MDGNLKVNGMDRWGLKKIYNQNGQRQKIIRFYINIYNKMLFFLLSYFIYSQIWLSHLMDYYHMGYTKKLEDKK